MSLSTVLAFDCENGGLKNENSSCYDSYNMTHVNEN